MSKFLITGASGFLGTIIVRNLSREHNLTTIGISETDDIYCDLASTVPTILSDFDCIIHVAGKAHIVPKNPREAEEFFQVNFEGTKNLIKGIEQSGKLPISVVFLSSVAVYGVETGELIKENQKRIASDPYGQSKLKAEDYLLEWGTKLGVKIGIIRPALIIGKDAPGNLGALIKGIKNGQYLNIDEGKARRSMVLADDLASFLPIISEKGGIYHLTDGYHPSFGEISNLVASRIGRRRIYNLPLSIAQVFSKIGDIAGMIIKKELLFNSRKLKKMTSSLTFDDSKARAIGWNPRSVIENPQLWLD